MKNILEVKNLSVNIETDAGTVEAVRDVSFNLGEGEVLAIVGESGCGKSMLCKAIMKLMPPTAHIVTGTVTVDEKDITHCREQEMRGIRGKMLAMVLQNPGTSLNPLMSVGDQIAEAVKIGAPHLTEAATVRRAVELMEMVEIDHSQERRRQYPLNFSGGMRQRVALAIALAARPRILFADEPTTSLDVTVQAQILDLLRKIQQEFRMGTVFVTHDLGVVARVAHRVAVMYAGKIVEIGTAEEIFSDPRHPYTWGLLHSLPYFAKGKKELFAVPGSPPSLINPPPGDAFAVRNQWALAIDYKRMPPLFRVTDTHFAATWLLAPEAPAVRFDNAGGDRGDE